MKKLLFLSALFCLSAMAYSQVDTLYPKGQTKIPCKIVEIGEFDIRYKSDQNPDGPVYVINRSKILKYTLANGYTEILRPDELLVENQYTEIQNRKSVIKVQPFSFVNNQISIAYEHVIKMGMNLDVELGYINNSITKETAGYNFVNSSGNPAPCTGVYLKPGVKFLLGQDFSLRGLKYAHPLKGRYIRIDLALSYMNYQDLSTTTYSSSAYNPSLPYNYTMSYTTSTSQLNTFAYGGMINYGRQFILGNVLTMEYYVGLGITGQTYAYKEASLSTGTYTNSGNGWYNYPPYNYYTSSDANYISNYHAFFRMPDVGLAFAAGFRIGYILPERKTQPKAKVSPEY